MARREFARIGTDMPDEPSIRALTHDEQWVYDHVLYLRPEMSRCGVVPYRPAVWAELATDLTETKIRKWTRGLAKQRHVVVDEKYSELLLRTYVRHDGLLGQPNVVAAMVADFHLIASPLIRTAFLTEMRRLWDLPDLTPGERGGWLLAMGHYPAPKTDGGAWPDVLPGDTLARLRKAIRTGLHPAMTEACRDGSVTPFDEHSPHGIPEPFTGPPRAGAIAVSAERRTPAPNSGSERRAPRPSGGGRHTLSQLRAQKFPARAA